MDAKIVQHYNKDKTTAHYPVTIPEAVVFDDGSNLKTKSAGYAPSSHVHDSDYYKKSEIDTKFRQLDSGDATETTTLNASNLTLTSGSGVVGSTGELRSGGLGSTWKSTNKISVDGYDFIEFLAVVRNTSSNMTLGYAFYDYNQSYLDGDRYSYNSELESSHSNVLTLAVPANAKYFSCTITQWNTDGFYIKLTKNASISSSLIDLTALETTNKTSVVAAINELKNQTYNDKLFGKGTGVGSIQQIGEGSLAKANGDWSFAAAKGIANGSNSIAMGAESTADGNYSFVIGTCNSNYTFTKVESETEFIYSYTNDVSNAFSASFLNDLIIDNYTKLHIENNTYTIISHSFEEPTIIIKTDSELPSLTAKIYYGIAKGNFGISFNGFAYGLQSLANNMGIAKGESSIALGQYSVASGYNSTAFGWGTIASNSNAFTEGSRTVASGSRSHAEGYRTTASGVMSHAEGQVTIASGSMSHSEGNYTTASGTGSHSEGNNTTSSGSISHAEGQHTVAKGAMSHTEGDFTSAENRVEHAQGSFNASHKASDTKGDAGNTLHSVGCAWAEADRKNAEEIMQNGDFYLLGVGGYDGTNPNTEGVKTVQSTITDILNRLSSLETDYQDALNLI